MERERFRESPRIRRSPETHELNVAHRIEGGPEYRLELEPEFDGALMIFLHGLTSAIRRELVFAPNAEVFDLPNGDAFMYVVESPGHLGGYQQIIDALAAEVDSLEAFPIVQKRTKQ